MADNDSSRYLDGTEARADVERRLKGGRKRARRKPLSDSWREKQLNTKQDFVILDRTAGCGPACPVVWEEGD